MKGEPETQGSYLMIRITELNTTAVDRDTTDRSDVSRNGIPNLFYIGTAKAGSTWIYNVLTHHPEIYMAPGKGLYFFDGHYDRGMPWYLSHFQAANGQPVLGEVSHSYLYSGDACQRIAELSPAARVMVCLRDPVDRAFSSYLDAIKNGQFDGKFDAALEAIPSILDRGRYATYLRPYVETFGRENIHIGVFDELAARPRVFARKLYEFLGVEPLELPDRMTKKMMPAGTPRMPGLVRLAKTLSAATKPVGARKLRGQIKTSRFIRNLLYRPFTDKNKPRMEPAMRAKLHEQYRAEVVALDELAGTDFQTLWGYE